jgi:hypothetical protein
MKGLKSILSILLLSLFGTGLYAQELPADGPEIRATGGVERDAASKGDIPAPESLTAISSTIPGGLWSSPSTWVGGVVPGAGDDVTISVGSEVVIDTDVTVANLTIGPDVSFTIGALSFDPTTARSLTVTGDLTVSGLGILTTAGTGTVTTHTITVGGNLTNNGKLDLSTNTNQAGAGLVFTGAANNTFGGGGFETDIRTITINKGTSSTNTLTLSVSNFTVQGSATDTAASGYLTLTNGMFKISGTFSGNHRTFPTSTYTIPATAGFWLNNANYTVAAQNGNVVVDGNLQISAGTYNQGTAAANIFKTGDLTGRITIDGGSANFAGSMRRPQFPGNSYFQSGGTVTTCIAGNEAPCFDMAAQGSGGSLVIQTPAVVPNDSSPDFKGNFIIPASTAGTTVRFGNAGTPGTGFFTCNPFQMPNLAIDTTSGPHTVKLTTTFFAALGSVNIGAGATLDIGNNQDFYMSGDTFINDGTLKVKPTSFVYFSRVGANASALNVTYSGTGSFSGPINQFLVGAASLTLDASAGSIRARVFQIKTANIVNAGHLTLGLGDATASTIQMDGPAAFDVAPVFDLGTGGQRLIYSNTGTRTIGPEFNPSRELVELSHHESADTLTITGGDLTLNGPLNVTGVIDTGANKINHMSGTASRFPGPSTTGYIKGTIVRKFTAGSPKYSFLVGDTHYAWAAVQPTSLTTDPAFVSVRAIDATLPGLLEPAVSHSWAIEQTGTMTSTLELIWDNVDRNPTPANYKMWRSTANLPSSITASTSFFNLNTVTAQGITDLNSTWGAAVLPPPITISGTVMASNGVGIRNAVVTLSGGSLTSPVSFQTGTFGTYQFQGVPAGGGYTVFVSAKRNRFTPPSQIVSSFSSVTDLNFTANPPE